MAQQVLVPDVGEAEEVEVIEVLVKIGDVVSTDDSLVVLESEKASMEIPSPFSGTVVAINVKEGDKVDEGGLILELDSEVSTTDSVETEQEQEQEQETEQAEAVPAREPEAEKVINTADTTATPAVSEIDADKKVHAGPAVRKQARQYGVELSDVKGSGRHGRVLKEDVQVYVKQQLTNKTAGDSGIPIVPVIDFSRFGEIELAAMSRIKRATARNLHRSWLNVPHVTQFDEADVTDLEVFRKSQNSELAGSDVKLTPLAFLIKACVTALQEYPQFNASLEAGYENLILKKYYNIGIAVETPEGLVVPVIRDAETKGVIELAGDCAQLAALAREKKLPLDAMQGASFSISSLGGIGGTKFTPIVNAPEVAILGVSRSKVSPHWNGSEFVPRTMLPLSLSYDHRAIDGAEAARFTRYLSRLLTDVRRMLL
ncbi:MAG: dihydrolipoyllysine-residue acetyltransferase [bacterium]